MNHQTKSKRKFTKVNNHPGIYKKLIWDEKKKKYVDSKYSQNGAYHCYRAYRRVRVNGKSELQTKYFSSIDDAKKWRLESKPRSTKLINRSYTLEQLIMDWRDWTKPPRFAPSTYQVVGYDIKHFKFLYDIPMEILSYIDIDNWLKHVINSNYPKNKTRCSFLREVKTLTTVLHWYKEYKNPNYQIPMLRRHRKDCFFKAKPKRKDLSLSVENLEKFLMQLKNHHKPLYYYIAFFQALTGCRIGEVCGLKWESVDLKNQTALIERTCSWHHNSRNPFLREQTKNGEDRVIVLSERVVDALKKWQFLSMKDQNPLGMVFHKQGGLMRYNSIQNAYKRAFKAQGLPVRSTHVLRHTFATIFAEQTGDIRGTQAALGHRDIRMTQHYAKIGERTIRKAMHKFELGKAKTMKPDPNNGSDQASNVIQLFKSA